MTLSIQLLGEIEVRRGGKRLALPQSKKTRALLAYLILTRKTHRRDRLCALFWDVTDDPRGALRWSLSKLRSLVNEGDTKRIVADRESASFEPAGAQIDVDRVCSSSIEDARTEDLEDCAKTFRGELLEGLELPDFHDFQAWLVAEREDLRARQRKILSTLVDRLSSTPEAALGHARALVEVDPLDEHSRARLVELLGQTGRRKEAEQIYESGTRLSRELGSRLSGVLEAAWRSLDTKSEPSAPAAPPPAPEHRLVDTPDRIIGRDAECARLTRTLSEVASERQVRVLFLTGEPGVGKTRLLTELISQARGQAGTVLDGRAYEVEGNRPYGPWIDALRRLDAAILGSAIGSELAPLLPELGITPDTNRTRERLFNAVVDLVAERAKAAPPVLIVLDDIQWLDDASAELLHYLVRMSRSCPMLVGLAARDGELVDNDAALRMIRSFQRDRLVVDIPVPPLDREATQTLARRIAPNADAERLFTTSAGNPLFVIESARVGSGLNDDVPDTLSELVRGRLDRLPPEAADVLRWGAVLGRGFAVNHLDELTTLGVDSLMKALETLERHALISSDETDSGYSFCHDVVRTVVYADVSQPRRRLMHRRVAEVLDEESETDESLAGTVAHHAALAGDAAMATKACIAAGRRCLRLFASSEAFALARRGMRYAEALKDPEQTTAMIELMAVSYDARRPEDRVEAGRKIEELAERALDFGLARHARIGYQLLSYLRWEGGEWSAAQQLTKKAELVTRGGDDRQRAVALAEAARCLALLERDLTQAESLIVEARALAERTGAVARALPDATGLLCAHRGQVDEARALFEEARTVARKEGHREGEFEALAHRVMLEIQTGGYAEARRSSETLLELAAKLREGSEGPFARALAALSTFALEGEPAVASVDAALEELRMVDAKHRLAFTLTRSALIDLERGKADRAATRAEEALSVAEILSRASETALSLAILVAAGRKSGSDVEERVEALRARPLSAVSADVRAFAERVLAEQ